MVKEKMHESSNSHFIKLDFEQSTEEWLSWRRGGIGASDAPVVMGLSPWQKEGELLLLKTGQRLERPANDAMQRGKRLEPGWPMSTTPASTWRRSACSRASTPGCGPAWTA
jgi:hypothetical protein